MGIFSTIGTAVGTYFGVPQIGAAAGSVIDGLRSENEQRNTNEMNAAEAQKNRDFQERMRSTQYQTTVQDLQKAGLNPMLAYTQGGAGTPGGSTPPQLQNKVSTGISSANQGAQTITALQQAQTNQAQLENLQAQTAKTKAETLSNSVATAIQAQQLDQITAQTENIDADTSNKRAEWRGKVADAGQKLEQFDADVRADTFSADSARRKALASKEGSNAILTKMAIPRAAADEKFYEDLGKANPYLKQILMMLQVLQGGRKTFTP